MRVLLVNNYSMKNAYSQWQKGTSGSQHVWGKVELERKGNVQVEIYRHEKYKFLNKIGSFFDIKNLDQQIRILGYSKNYDILYAPYSTSNTKALIVLKWLGLFKKPIVVTIHQPFLGTKSRNKWIRKFTKKMLLQYEASIFLSEPLLKDTINLLKVPANIVEEKFTTAQWGPDFNFYKNLDLDIPLRECNYVVSAGHTDRDYETLIEAFRGLDIALRIYCTSTSLPKTKDIPENVSIYSDDFTYLELLNHYKGAKAFLIPLAFPKKEGCQGMTSLQDVVAMGKPVIMTKNKSLNLDIEQEGFGVYVEVGDIEGWRNAVKRWIYDEEALNKMAINARRVYKEKFNSKIFADTLEKVLFRVYNKKVKKIPLDK